MQRGVRLSTSFFRRLIIAYSAEYRERFGDEMAQVFRDLCLDVYRKEGLGGLARLWAGTLVDLLKTSIEERIGKLPLPSDDELVVLGSWSAVLGGIVSLILAFTHASPDWIEWVFRLEWIWPSLGILYFAGLLGLGAQRRLRGEAADFGLVIAYLGAAGMVISGTAMLFMNLIWVSFGNGMLILAGGLIMSGLTSLLSFRSTGMGAVLLADGTFTLLLAMFTPNRNMGLLFRGDSMLFAILMGLGWIATGLTLLRDRRQRTLYG